MLESTAKSQAPDAGASSASTKKNPFELFASIFAKKKSLVQETDLDTSEDCEFGQINDENLFPCEPEAASVTSSHRPSRLVNQRNDSTERDTHSLSSENSSCSPSGCSKRSSVKYDLEALHLSRQDNPYLQHLEKLSAQEERPPSLELQSSSFKNLFLSESEQENVDLHQHLIRSPPPQFPQNVSRFIYSRANSPRHHNKEASSSSLEILEQNLKNGKKTKFLKPIQSKSDMDVLDPSIRQVLEYQKKQLFTGIQRSISSNQMDYPCNAPQFVPVTPTCLREISYHPQSRWVHSKGSRPTPKCHPSESTNLNSLAGAKACYLELFPSDDQTSRKTPLGPITVGRTCTGP